MDVKWVAGLVAGCVMVVVLSGAAPAMAAAPWWQVSSGALPTSLPPGGEGEITVDATNVGDGSVNGASDPVTVSDTPPAGLTATAITGSAGLFEEVSVLGPVSCHLASLSCTFEGRIPPFERLHVAIAVKVAEGAVSGLDNEASILGGEAPSAVVRQPVTVSSTPVAFGVEDYEMTPEDEVGSPDTQAGSHPFQVTFSTVVNRTGEPPYQPALPKDLHFDLPAGFVGNPQAIPQCTDAQFSIDREHPVYSNECPVDTVVGVTVATVARPGTGSVSLSVPVFNLVPAVGEPARFGFEVLGNPVILDTAVRTGGDYGVTVDIDNITEDVRFYSDRLTLWGVPGDPRHDGSRGWGCVGLGLSAGECTSPEDSQRAPFLTLPTSCGVSSSEPLEFVGDGRFVGGSLGGDAAAGVQVA